MSSKSSHLGQGQRHLGALRPSGPTTMQGYPRFCGTVVGMLGMNSATAILLCRISCTSVFLPQNNLQSPPPSPLWSLLAGTQGPLCGDRRGQKPSCYLNSPAFSAPRAPTSAAAYTAAGLSGLNELGPEMKVPPKVTACTPQQPPNRNPKPNEGLNPRPRPRNPCPKLLTLEWPSKWAFASPAAPPPPPPSTSSPLQFSVSLGMPSSFDQRQRLT